MAYTSIYRKYRPDTFQKVIGQEHIVRTLKNQILTDTIGHAYIFTGTRGTGKTSVAKIFAKAVNCLHPVDGSPCGKCENCIELSKGSNFDILEIDAASNNSVDQMRELTDKINFPPTVGKYKVYIIDEVHMLSKSAYNALLKTLEEPPSHAIFILATTEIHQIPATILSRCLRFDFRLVSNAEIATRIRFIFDEMQVKCEAQAVDLIASSGNGSVRDALSIADMCVSYSAGDITYQSVLEVLGASDPKKLIELATAMADGDVDKTLQSVAVMADLGKSIPILAADIATLFRNLLYIKNCATSRNMLALPNEIYDALKVMADKYSNGKCLFIMKQMSGLEGEFRYSSQHRIIFEAAAVISASGDGGNTGSIGNGGNSADDKKMLQLSNKILQLEKDIAEIKKNGLTALPSKNSPMDIWKLVAKKLTDRSLNTIAFALANSQIEIKGDEFIATFTKKADIDIVGDSDNTRILKSIFAEISELHLVIEYDCKEDDEAVLIMLKNMFGQSLEVK
ncbi:MAG: DNA polymerase III subunit gamma/tau [Clostridia bacterium]